MRIITGALTLIHPSTAQHSMAQHPLIYRKKDHSSSISELRLLTNIRRSLTLVNTLRLITVTGAGHRTYATCEYETLGFSGLRKRSRCEIVFHTSDRLPLLWPYC